MADTLDSLLDLAETGIRQKGYNAVSFRELADSLGIKSASVHYYFRKKEDLGLALVDRYSGRFFQNLEEKTKNVKSKKERVRLFCQSYEDALASAKAICLCGMLGAEADGLPPQLSRQVAAFFEANIHWLADELPGRLGKEQRLKRAKMMVATLQGGMMLSNSMNDPAMFGVCVEELLANLENDISEID